MGTYCGNWDLITSRKQGCLRKIPQVFGNMNAFEFKGLRRGSSSAIIAQLHDALCNTCLEALFPTAIQSLNNVFEIKQCYRVRARLFGWGSLYGDGLYLFLFLFILRLRRSLELEFGFPRCLAARVRSAAGYRDVPALCPGSASRQAQQPISSTRGLATRPGWTRLNNYTHFVDEICSIRGYIRGNMQVPPLRPEH